MSVYKYWGVEVDTESDTITIAQKEYPADKYYEPSSGEFIPRDKYHSYYNSYGEALWAYLVFSKQDIPYMTYNTTNRHLLPLVKELAI